MKIYDFFSDPGHGWLKVKRSELTELGIEGKITEDSEQRGEFVYLEEDQDASTFIEVLEAKTGEKFDTEKHLRRHIADRRSRIRSYESYKVNKKTYCGLGYEMR